MSLQDFPDEMTRALQRFTGLQVVSEGPVAISDSYGPGIISPDILGIELSILSERSGAPHNEQILEAITRAPIPIFGSPPEKWATLTTLGAVGSYAAAVATLVELGHPVIAGFTATTSFLIYLCKPVGDVVRQNLADRLERRLRLPPERAGDELLLPKEVQELPPSTFY